MISIVIPTLNEEQTLSKTINHTFDVVSKKPQVEVMVVDAGSQDQTLGSIQDLPVKSHSRPEFKFKKYASLNEGASKTKGAIILFLDADTLLPHNFDLLIEEKLKDHQVVAGAFEFSFKDPDWKLRLLTLINRIRYRFGNIFYGDQGLWVKREVFEKVGGFPEEPLMETAYLCRKLKGHGKLSLIKKSIQTSARRFQEHGFFAVSWFDLNMFIRFNFGLSISGYARKYWSKNLTNSTN